MSKEYNLFMGHSWCYSDAFERFKRLLDVRPYFCSRPYFRYRDYSVLECESVQLESDEELYQSIYNKMEPCHIAIILAGVYATYSKWIDKEILIAKNEFPYPKPILAIKPWWGDYNISLPVTQNADAIVDWSTISVIRAIREVAI